ncbi:hypothetical protein [Curtobacterium sp. 'Ferrero']|uniref:hypothetical protein n=1 Tax=Curtobacterium sp. 'Ferrero' TaxID=2033654 RepID=UPI0011419E58|nr:hypothetical protein [Curtobacterium sp. 'Ferrero']
MRTIWIDHVSHWKAAGEEHADGSMSDATVDDNNGTTRTRNASFSSKSDFSSWVKSHQGRSY